jgi:hypothetical protein
MKDEDKTKITIGWISTGFPTSINPYGVHLMTYKDKYFFTLSSVPYLVLKQKYKVGVFQIGPTPNWSTKHRPYFFRQTNRKYDFGTGIANITFLIMN